MKNNILYLKNKSKYHIVFNIVNIIDKINIKNKILYFTYSYTEEDLKKIFKIFNNKNIIIINKKSFDINKIEKYLSYSRPNYVVIDYIPIYKCKILSMHGKRLRYIFHKLEEYKKKYNIKFIVAINKENENKSGDL